MIVTENLKMKKGFFNKWLWMSQSRALEFKNYFHARVEKNYLSRSTYAWNSFFFMKIKKIAKQNKL